MLSKCFYLGDPELRVVTVRRDTLEARRVIGLNAAILPVFCGTSLTEIISPAIKPISVVVIDNDAITRR